MEINPKKLTKKNSTFLILALACLSFIASLFGSFAGTRLQAITTRQNEVSEATANYYASAVSAYYSSNELVLITNEGIDLNSPEYITKYQLDDKHYNDFLNATAVLASQVPKDIRQEVLKTQELWGQIKEDTAANEDLWFEHLDKTTSIIYSRINNNEDPVWNHSGLFFSLFKQL